MTADRDVVAGSIIDSYVQFLREDIGRCPEALGNIKNAPSELGGLLPPTVAAGLRLDPKYFLAEVLQLLGHAEIEIGGHAVFSIGDVHTAEDADIRETAISALEEVAAKETDDYLLSSVLRSALALDGGRSPDLPSRYWKKGMS